jgi:hypothetical protein
MRCTPMQSLTRPNTTVPKVPRPLPLWTIQEIIFACFVSAYQYRSKFMHIGFPIPGIVTESMGFQDDLGTAYLHPTVGMTWSRMFRPDGLKEEDLIDVHELIEPAAFKEFRDVYFYLLPTWYFMKGFAREAILSKVAALGVPRS